jgi:hypothetical protein
MSLRIFKNRHGVLGEVQTEIENISGWWNSIAAGDFDEDGDMDYVVGNLGLNTPLKATHNRPLCVYAKDYDKNGLIDPIMCYYVEGENQIFATRDDMVRQINAMRSRFNTYESYATASFDQSFTTEEIKDAFILKAECFESSYFQNLGESKFKRTPLPIGAQFAPVFGLLPGDYNNDGYLDVLVAGNSFATEASTGRYDAMKGTLLAGDGQGNFREDNAAINGFRADGDVKALAKIYLKENTNLVLVAKNNDRTEAYRFAKADGHTVTPQPNDMYALVTKNNGKTYKHEFYYGSNYLSNSSRRLTFNRNVNTVTIYDNKGQKRTMKF